MKRGGNAFAPSRTKHDRPIRTPPALWGDESLECTAQAVGAATCSHRPGERQRGGSEREAREPVDVAHVPHPLVLAKVPTRPGRHVAQRCVQRRQRMQRQRQRQQARKRQLQSAQGVCHLRACGPDACTTTETVGHEHLALNPLHNEPNKACMLSQQTCSNPKNPPLRGHPVADAHDGPPLHGCQLVARCGGHPSSLKQRVISREHHGKQDVAHVQDASTHVADDTQGRARPRERHALLIRGAVAQLPQKQYRLVGLPRKRGAMAREWKWNAGAEGYLQGSFATVACDIEFTGWSMMESSARGRLRVLQHLTGRNPSHAYLDVQVLQSLALPQLILWRERAGTTAAAVATAAAAGNKRDRGIHHACHIAQCGSHTLPHQLARGHWHDDQHDNEV